MKRSKPLARKKPMDRGKGLAPGKGLARGKIMARGPARVKPVNRKRRAASFDRNFGDEAVLVRTLPCLVCKAAPSEPAHVTSRGAGGGRFDLVPLCSTHHREQHARGIETFASAHGLDLRAEADRVALLHDATLGVRGLAQRFVVEELRFRHAWESGEYLRSNPRLSKHRKVAEEILAKLEKLDPEVAMRPLDTYEREALLGWVRRLMQAKSDALSARWGGPRQPGRLRLRADVGDALGIAVAEAEALCDLAGWPS